MRTLERYIFRQMLTPVCGAIAALTAFVLFSQSLSQFDFVVQHGQSGLTFVKMALLSLPPLAGLILPFGLLIGAIVALSRLQGEHEFTVMFAGGVPLSRIASPMIHIGVYVALLSLASNLFLQPVTARAMREEQYRIKNDLISALIREGEFSTSDSGLTIYVQRIDQNGLLRQIFIRTPSASGEDQTYAAKEGRIKSVHGSSILIMRRGSTQQMSGKRVLSHTTFDETSFDVAPYFSSDSYLTYKEGDRYLHELLFPNLVLPWENKDFQKKQIAEAHARLAAPLYNLTFLMLAIVAVLGGRFSRSGYAGRIAIAFSVAAVTRIIGVVFETASQDMVAANILQYVVPLVPIVICALKIRKADSVNAPMAINAGSQLRPLTTSGAA
jgi:lipopolysaccharide export system permease protein